MLPLPQDRFHPAGRLTSEGLWVPAMRPGESGVAPPNGVEDFERYKRYLERVGAAYVPPAAWVLCRTCGTVGVEVEAVKCPLCGLKFTERPAMKKKEFEIEVTYFKPSGKLYTSSTFKKEFEDVGPEGHPSCYMHEVSNYIRGMRRNGGQGAMPGLSEQNEGWEGFILIDCDEGFPCLLLPS